MAETSNTGSGQAKMHHVAYKSPPLKGPRAGIRLAQTETMWVNLQVFKPGIGERELHAHTGMDGLWLVMRGKARFYDDKEQFIEAGPLEAVFVPRDAPYWFENAGDEPLELLQVESIDKRIPNKLVRLRPNNEPERVESFTPDGKLISDTVSDRRELDKLRDGM